MAEPEPNRRRKHKTHRPPLSAREIRFCQRLMETEESQHDAYLAVGFPAKDTRRATEQAAHRLVKKRVVREYLRKLQDHAAEAAKVTVEELAAVMAGIVRADRRKLYDRHGTILPPDQWPDDVAATVEQVESEEVFEPVPGEKGKRRLRGYVRKVKTASRVAAATKLMEWKRMLGAEKTDPGKAAPAPLTIEKGNRHVPPPTDRPGE